MSAASAHFIRRIPDGEDRERLTCADCGYIAYENPKIVTGSVVSVDGRILLCRRAIEPRREALEEACAEIALEGVLALYSIARIGQVQVLFRASLATPGFAAGPESLEVRLFGWEEIPWADLAFPSVHWVLKAWREAGPGPLGAPRTNPPDDMRGTRPLQGGV